MSAPAGRDPLHLQLGRERVAVASADPGFRRLLAERYGAFAVEGPATFTLEVRVTGPAPAGPAALREARRAPLRLLGRRPLRLAGEGFTAELGDAAGVVAGPRATYPVDLLLVALWSLRHARGLVVHSAALATGRGGVLCTGPSGSGKSTLAGLFPRRAMCDELVGVELTGDAAVVTALPFWTGRPGRAPLAGVYFLRHAPAHRRRPLAPARAFPLLLRQVLWPAFDRGLLAAAVDALGELVERVPAWELGFRPERSVWPLLAGAAEAAR